VVLAYACFRPGSVQVSHLLVPFLVHPLVFQHADVGLGVFVVFNPEVHGPLEFVFIPELGFHLVEGGPGSQSLGVSPGHVSLQPGFKGECGVFPPTQVCLVVFILVDELLHLGLFSPTALGVHLGFPGVEGL
jgi:hypothetical protein